MYPSEFCQFAETLFNELPLNVCIDIVSVKSKKLKGYEYSHCAMCSKTRNLIAFKHTPVSYGEINTFCKRGSCYENYGKCLEGDLSNGIPFIWKKIKTTEKYYSPVPQRQRNLKGGLIPLVCVYCGIQSFNVVAHPLVPKEYGNFTSFCKNDVCFASFTFGIDNRQQIIS
jgi:hypothetical protein